MRMIRDWCRTVAVGGTWAIVLGLAACGEPTGAAPPTFRVGGTVTGLEGVGCVLRMNGADDLSLSANGPFTFSTPLPTGTDFTASMFQRPRGPNQICAIINHSGTVSGTDLTNIVVACAVERPACAVAQDLGTVSGDEGAGTTFATGTGEGWYRIRILENSTSSIYISAHVILDVPGGIDYDLQVYCLSCGGLIAGTSTRLSGIQDVVEVRWADRSGTSDSADILIHVAYFNGQSGSPWNLRVRGNQIVASTTCTL